MMDNAIDEARARVKRQGGSPLALIKNGVANIPAWNFAKKEALSELKHRKQQQHNSKNKGGDDGDDGDGDGDGVDEGIGIGIYTDAKVRCLRCVL